MVTVLNWSASWKLISTIKIKNQQWNFANCLGLAELALDEIVQWAARLLSVPCRLADRVHAAMSRSEELPSRRVWCLAKFPVILKVWSMLNQQGHVDMYCRSTYALLSSVVGSTRFFQMTIINLYFFLNLVRTFWMEGLTRTEPAVSRACSAGPGPYLPIGIFRVIGRI